MIGISVARADSGESKRAACAVGSESGAIMCESDVSRIERTRCRRRYGRNCLSCRSDYLNLNLQCPGRGTENAGVEIHFIGGSDHGGERLGNAVVLEIATGV